MSQVNPTDIFSRNMRFIRKQARLANAAEGEETSGILRVLPIKNPYAPEPVIYHGVKELIPAWETYYRRLNAAVIRNGRGKAARNTSAGEKKDTFQILIQRDTKDLIGIHDSGKYQLTVADILFCTPYLPIRTHQPETAAELIKRARETLDLFDAEVRHMYAVFPAKPLFLVERLRADDYLAWSLAEDKYMYVYEYKSYSKTFRVSEVTIDASDEIRVDHTYGIIPPTRALIQAISTDDTDMDPAIWSRKMIWNAWEPRPKKNAIPLHDQRYKEIYTDAIRLINRSRTAECGLDSLFAQLENRVERLERLNSLMAPDAILSSEADMVRQTVDAITSALQTQPEI